MVERLVSFSGKENCRPKMSDVCRKMNQEMKLRFQDKDAGCALSHNIKKIFNSPRELSL
jgi:hypothetical protein